MHIPDLQCPYSSPPQQPVNRDVLVDDTHALMARADFDLLLEYSMSIPTGAYEGKMWKAYGVDRWYLRWYQACKEDPGMLDIMTREMIIIEEAPDA